MERRDSMFQLFGDLHVALFDDRCQLAFESFDGGLPVRPQPLLAAGFAPHVDSRQVAVEQVWCLEQVQYFNAFRAHN